LTFVFNYFFNLNGYFVPLRYLKECCVFSPSPLGDGDRADSDLSSSSTEQGPSEEDDDYGKTPCPADDSRFHFHSTAQKNCSRYSTKPNTNPKGDS